MEKIWVDFHKVEEDQEELVVKLDTYRTLCDLYVNEIDLYVGKEVVVRDEDFEAPGVVQMIEDDQLVVVAKTEDIEKVDSKYIFDFESLVKIMTLLNKTLPYNVM